MSVFVVLAAVLVATGAWIVLFRGDRADIWPRTWLVAGALIAFSTAALASLGRLADAFGPVDRVTLGAGVGVGLAWLVATHIGHAVLCRLFPSFIEQVRDLYRLGVDEPWPRVLGPIAAMAVAEELLFRGVIGGIGGFALGVAVYSAVQVLERKWALVLAAFLGGAIWGGLFELTGGLVAPAIAHVLWTGALTLVWPLRGCGPVDIETPADSTTPAKRDPLSACRETMSTVIAAFSISPLGAGESVSAAVAEAVRIVRASGLPNETNAMFTNIEGEWDEVMAVIKECMDAVAEVSPRVSLVVKIDHRTGVTGGLSAKVEAVEAHLRND